MREINGYQREITDLNNQIKHFQQIQQNPNFDSNPVQGGPYNRNQKLSYDQQEFQESYYLPKRTNAQNESNFLKESNINESFSRKDKIISGPESNKLDVSRYYGDQSTRLGSFSRDSKDQKSSINYDKSPMKQQNTLNQNYGYKSISTSNLLAKQNPYDQDQNITNRKASANYNNSNLSSILVIYLL